MYSGVLNVVQNNSPTYVFQIKDLLDNTVNLNGYTGFAALTGQGFSGQFNLNIFQPQSGIFSIGLNSFQTAALPIGSGNYEISFYGLFDYDNQFQFARGDVNIIAGVPTEILQGVITDTRFTNILDGGQIIQDTLDGGNF